MARVAARPVSVLVAAAVLTALAIGVAVGADRSAAPSPARTAAVPPLGAWPDSDPVEIGDAWQLSTQPGVLQASAEPVEVHAFARSGGEQASTGPGAMQASAEPGVWQLELGGFTWLEDVIAFGEDDVWAVGDGIVHYDGTSWQQTAGLEHPIFHAVDGFSSEALWAVGEVYESGCGRSGFVMRRDAGGWHPEPVSTHQPLFDVAMLSETDGWAVGGIDVAVILRYDGTAWRETAAPETKGLLAIHVVDEDTAWAVGDGGAIARYDGRHWLEVESPTAATLLDVHLLDERVGWAVGLGDGYRLGSILAFESGDWFVDVENTVPELHAVHTLGPSTALAVGRGGALLYFDGRSWRETGRTHPGGYVPYVDAQPHPAASTPRSEAGQHGTTDVLLRSPGELSSLADATARRERVLRVGSAGEPSAGGRGEMGVGAARALQYRPPDAPWGESSALRGLCLMPDAETLLAVGDAGQIVHIDDQVWSEVHAGRSFAAIDMRTVDDGWLVGADGSPLHWDGVEWRAHRVPRRSRYLRDVATVAPDDAWAVGDNGAVVHWDGARWTAWPAFTRSDLDSVAFGASDDGWVVANVRDETDYSQEAWIFHWDGVAWERVFRQCHVFVTDVAAAGRGDVWFATGGMELLHVEGASWTWHQVHGRESPGAPGAYVRSIALTEDGGWGVGYGLARFDGRVWRTEAHGPEAWPYDRDVAATDTSSYWALRPFWEESVHRYGWFEERSGYEVSFVGPYGDGSVALRTGIGLSAIDAMVDDEGRLHVWAVGRASTVLHYRATEPDVTLPEPTATPLLPAPELQPSPTPRSSLRADEVRDMILDRRDPDGERGLRVTRVDLTTVHEVDDLFAAYSLEDFWHLGGTYRSRAERCYAWRPVWFVVVEGAVPCAYMDGFAPSHLVLVLDDATGREEVSLCFAKKRGQLHFPIAVGGGQDPARVPTPHPTSTPRNVTPQPAVSVEGPCPTVTPRPHQPPIGYP